MPCASIRMTKWGRALILNCIIYLRYFRNQICLHTLHKGVLEFPMLTLVRKFQQLGSSEIGSHYGIAECIVRLDALAIASGTPTRVSCLNVVGDTPIQTHFPVKQRGDFPKESVLESVEHSSSNPAYSCRFIFQILCVHVCLFLDAQTRVHTTIASSASVSLSISIRIYISSLYTHIHTRLCRSIQLFYMPPSVPIPTRVYKKLPFFLSFSKLHVYLSP